MNAKKHYKHLVAALCIGLFTPLSADAATLQDTTTFHAGSSNQKADRSRTIPDAANPGGDDVTIDVLAFYTDRFAMLLHPKINQQDLVDSFERSYAEINSFFENSGLKTRFKLVGIELWNPPRSARVQDDLAALIQYAEVNTDLRDIYAADLVQLWDQPELGYDSKDTCGWGQLIGPNRTISNSKFGYSIVMKGAPDSEFSDCYAYGSPEKIAELAAHEIGHNLGSGHEAEDSLQGAFKFSHGRKCEKYGDRSTGSLMTNVSRHTYFSDGFGESAAKCQSDVSDTQNSNNKETFTRTASYLADLRVSPNYADSVQIRTLNSIDESAGTLLVELYRSQASTPATVELKVFLDEASSTDFDSALSQTVAFAVDQTQVQIELLIADDSMGESDEQFTLWLQRPQGIAIGQIRSQRVYILDNDPLPVAIALQTFKSEFNTNDSIELSWQTRNAGACQAQSRLWRGKKPIAGRTVLSPQAAGDYSLTLSCENAHNLSAVETVVFKVTSAPASAAGSGGALGHWFLLLFFTTQIVLRRNMRG